MSDAIKDSERNDPAKRALAAVIFSYIGTREALADLKTLANDSDPHVAKLAKERLSGEQDPGAYEFDEERVPKAFLPKQ
jgi:HEAT repeat protein